MMYLAIQVSHRNAVGCSPLGRHASALHKRVSAHLRILIAAAAKSVPPGRLKTRRRASIRVGSNFSRAFQSSDDDSRSGRVGSSASRRAERRELRPHSADGFSLVSELRSRRKKKAAPTLIPVCWQPAWCHGSCCCVGVRKARHHQQTRNPGRCG